MWTMQDEENFKRSARLNDPKTRKEKFETIRQEKYSRAEREVKRATGSYF